MRYWILALALLITCASGASAFEFKWPGDKGKAAEAKKAENVYREARSAYGSADYANTIKLSSKAIKLNPELAKAYGLRGKASKDMGDVDGAIKDLDHAIKLDPKLGEAYYTRAQTHEIMGDMKKAGADYKKGCSAGFRDACE
ncbi:hypothetical protein MNBD_NITROSPINAE04-2712 [hydrothermal vent metagenome]|uniref:Uncharacterized protein n=1 Tax=hydrothermal vent metagenome TaxID=652676 RepID=A0A3B1CB32_9ZZZZ